MEAYTILVLLREAPTPPDAALPGREFLMVKNARRNLLWELPGGRALPNEAPDACARRECLEETGHRMEEPRLIQERTSPLGHGYVFVGRLGPRVGNPDPSEIVATRYFARLPAREELSFPDDPYATIFSALRGT